MTTNWPGYPCKKCGATEPENDPMIPSGSHVCEPKKRTTTTPPPIPAEIVERAFAAWKAEWIKGGIAWDSEIPLIAALTAAGLPGLMERVRVLSQAIDKAKDVLSNTDIDAETAAHRAYLILVNGTTPARRALENDHE